MNAKQTAPLLAALPAIATAAPPLIVLGAIGFGTFLVLKWLTSDDAEKKPETPEFRPIPAEMPVKPAAVPTAVPRVSAVTPPPSAPTVPKVSASVRVPAAVIRKIEPEIPPLPPIKKKFITREDLATAFQHGARAITRTAAVMALKNLGFGKTAAYEALSPNGRFSAWLQIAPDGMITWTE